MKVGLSDSKHFDMGKQVRSTIFQPIMHSRSSPLKYQHDYRMAHNVCNKNAVAERTLICKYFLAMSYFTFCYCCRVKLCFMCISYLLGGLRTSSATIKGWSLNDSAY